MKIGFIGNTANTMYIMASCFNREGYDAEYFMIPSDFIFSQPAWEDCEQYVLYEELHSKIQIREIRKQWQQPSWVIERNISSGYNRKIKKLIRSRSLWFPDMLKDINGLREFFTKVYPFYTDKLIECDWVVTTSLVGLLSSFLAKVPYVFIPHGADARSAAGTGESISSVSLQQLVISAIQNCLMCGSQGSNMMEILDQIVDPKKLRPLPKMFDPNVYRPLEDLGDFPFLPDEVNQLINSEDRIVLFMPSRYSNRWKGTSRFMDAYLDTIEEYPDRLFLITSGWGEDFEYYRKLLGTDLRSRESIYFLDGVISKGYLRKFYNKVDVVVDQFVLGWYGSVLVEAAACGKMVLIYLDQVKWAKYLGDLEFPPISNCHSKSDIRRTLSSLASFELDIHDEGAKMLAWAVRNHSMFQVIPKMVDYVIQSQSAYRQE